MTKNKKLLDQIENLLTANNIATDKLESFLESIDTVYHQFDKDRLLLEGYIDSSTQQFIQNTIDLKNELAAGKLSQQNVQTSNALLSTT